MLYTRINYPNQFAYAHQFKFDFPQFGLKAIQVSLALIVFLFCFR